MSTITVYIFADLVLAVSYIILNVQMMLRFHARKDLKWRWSLLGLAGLFFISAVYCLHDAWSISDGPTETGAYIRVLAAINSLAVAIVMANPRALQYYRAVAAPNPDVEYHFGEVKRLLSDLYQGEGKNATKPQDDKQGRSGDHRGQARCARASRNRSAVSRERDGENPRGKNCKS